uniref:Protein kinase domain-containing protein n=1 Tax=Acrobeloides nanus TaxID=290746 RepID=A0A914DRU3_9BILA
MEIYSYRKVCKELNNMKIHMDGSGFIHFEKNNQSFYYYNNIYTLASSMLQGKLCFKSKSTGSKQEYDIAIKEVKISGDFKETQRIIDEAKIMSMVEHTNVLAMDYLKTKNIVHGDLATRNVLISIVSEPNNEDLEVHKYSYKVQVADFGLAKIVKDVVSEEAFFPAIPIKWAAIEAKMKSMIISPLFHHNQSLHESIEEENKEENIWLEKKYYVIEGFFKYLDGGGRLKIPNIANGELVTIMTCWMKNPSDRPNFGKLKQDFEIAMNEPGKFINILSIGGHQETKVVEEDLLESVPNETDTLLNETDTRLQTLVDRHREVDSSPNISNPYAERKFDPVRKNGSKLNSDNEIDTLSDEGVDEEPDSGVISPSSNDEDCDHNEKMDSYSKNRNVEEFQKAASFPRNYVSKLKCFDNNAEQQFQNPYI